MCKSAEACGTLTTEFEFALGTKISHQMDVSNWDILNRAPAFSRSRQIWTWHVIKTYRSKSMDVSTYTEACGTLKHAIH